MTGFQIYSYKLKMAKMSIKKIGFSAKSVLFSNEDIKKWFNVLKIKIRLKIRKIRKYSFQI